MPLRELGMEDARHPGRRRQARLVRDEPVAGAHDVAVRPEHRALLGRRDDVGAVVGEVGEQLLAGPLGVVHAGTGQRREGGQVERQRGEGRGGREERPHDGVRRGRGTRRYARLRQARGEFGDGAVGGRRGRGVVAAVDPVEAGGQRGARRELFGAVLEHRKRVLVLEACAGQTFSRQSRRRRAVEVRAPDDLERVGAPRHCLTQTAEQQPRDVRGRHVLPDGDRGARRPGLDRGQVEVLRDVVLVDPQLAVGRERDVLGLHDVDRRRLRTAVEDLDVPEPGGVGLGQDEADPEGQVAPGAADLGAGRRPPDLTGARGAEKRRHRDAVALVQT